VVDGDGATLGTVAEVMETGGEAKVLVVRGPEGETLLPFAGRFVKAVDLAAGSIVVERPEYVLAD
jgi:ribosomal 30S subunit maturation factor RimM